jgi:hypothetical protein
MRLWILLAWLHSKICTDTTRELQPYIAIFMEEYDSIELTNDPHRVVSRGKRHALLRCVDRDVLAVATISVSTYVNCR